MLDLTFAPTSNVLPLKTFVELCCQCQCHVNCILYTRNCKACNVLLETVPAFAVNTLWYTSTVHTVICCKQTCGHCV